MTHREKAILTQSKLILRSVLAIVSAFIIYVICYRFIDLPLAISCHYSITHSILWDSANRLGILLKPSHWIILAVVVFVIALISRFSNKESPAWRAMLFFSLSIIVAYVICAVLKMLLGRYRPIEFFQHAKYGFHFLTTKHDMMSSPSGHTTCAFAGLFALGRVFKKNWLTLFFLIIAAVIGISRIIAGAHYLGDVFFGAYVGILSTFWVEAALHRKNS